MPVSNKTTFWLNDLKDNINNNAVSVDKLMAFKFGLSNFVKIISRTDARIIFSNDDKPNRTNGKNIYITHNISDNTFDIVVGVLMHESSHILLSDFELLNLLFVKRKANKLIFPKSIISEVSKSYSTELVNCLNNINDNYNLFDLIDLFKDLSNWIEDRRIDNYIFTNFNGYREYYIAFYKEFFFNSKIGKYLKSDEARDNSLNSYMFRIINILNADTELYALPGLNEIYDLIDINNISRLKSTENSVLLAYQIMLIVLKHITTESPNTDNTKNQNNDQTNNNNNNTPNNNTTNSKPLINKSKIKQIAQKILDDQTNFLSGQFKIKADSQGGNNDDDFSNNYNQLVEFINEPGFIVKKYNEYIKNSYHDIYIIILENYKQFMENIKSNSDLMDRTVINSIIDNTNIYKIDYSNAYYQGLDAGKSACNKIINILNKSTLDASRLKSGKIDSKLLSSIGYGNTRIFKKTYYPTAKTLLFYITVDLSGSMLGESINNTIKVISSIAYISTQIQNITVLINYRTSVSQNKTNTYPIIINIYNSKKNTLVDLYNAVTNIVPSGPTPEALMYQYMIDEYNSLRNNYDDSFFITITDGVPAFELKNINVKYYRNIAYDHTKLKVNKIYNLSAIYIQNVVKCEHITNVHKRPISSWEDYNKIKPYSKEYVKDFIYAMYSCYGKNTYCIQNNNIVDISTYINELIFNSIK